MTRIAVVLLSLLLVACRGTLRSSSFEEQSALAAAIRVLPTHEQTVRVVIGEAPQALGRDAAVTLAALPSRVDGLRWFSDQDAATEFCRGLEDERRCAHLVVDSIQRVGAVRRVFVTTSALGGCGYHEYRVDVLVVESRVDVRAVVPGEVGSCGVRRPSPS
jgi:hypothetical protein